MIIGGILLRSDCGDDNWWSRVLYIGLIVGGIWIFNNGYNNLPKDKIMTPKELYDWAVGMGAENCDIMVNGMAIDYYPPTIDHTIQTIEIKQPMIR